MLTSVAPQRNSHGEEPGDVVALEPLRVPVGRQGGHRTRRRRPVLCWVVRRHIEQTNTGPAVRVGPVRGTASFACGVHVGVGGDPGEAWAR